MSKIIILAERLRADREQKTDMILAAICISIITVTAIVAIRIGA